jgi:hypothetical protein
MASVGSVNPLTLFQIEFERRENKTCKQGANQFSYLWPCSMARPPLTAEQLAALPPEGLVAIKVRENCGLKL